MRRALVAVVLVVGAVHLLAGCGDGGDERRDLAGFGQVGFRVSGSTAERCALLAATAEARARGLMGQDDFRGFDGMVFAYTEDTTTTFYMFGTTLPLSIAWFDADGRFLDAADMDPCPADDADECPTYGPGRPYRHAIEVGQGDLDDLGIVPGAVLTLVDSC